MTEEKQPFERLTKALPNLNNADLLSLLKTIDGLMHTKYSDPALRGKRFEAHGTFYRQPSGQSLALEEMLQLIKTLDPAELQVLRTLAPYYFDRTRYLDGQQISATWGTTNSHLHYSSNVMASGQGAISQDEMEQRAEQFKAIMNLLTPAQEAKAAGDDEKAAELLAQATDLLKEQGISGPMLEYFRSLFQN